MEQRQFGTETSINVMQDHAKSPKQLTRKQKLELWKQKQSKKRKPKNNLKRTHQNAFGGLKTRSGSKKRRRHVTGKKKERSASKTKVGSKKITKKPTVAVASKELCVKEKQDNNAKPKEQPKSEVKVSVAAPPAIESKADASGMMTPGKPSSNLASLKQRLSVLKQSAKRINPSAASRRKAEEELQKSLRKWKQDRERAVSSVKKSSATARRLREQQAARVKALQEAKAAKAKAKKKPRYASKQRIAMLSRPKQVNKAKVARMRKAFNKEQISVKAKSTFIMFCSDMEEIKQMLKVNLRDQACEQLSQIHKQPQYKIIKKKALYYIMRAAAYEDLQMFKEATACFAEGKKHVTTEANTLEAAETQFTERLAAHQKKENDRVNDLLFSPLEDIEEPVAKTLMFDEPEQDVFEEIKAPVLHACKDAEDLLKEVSEPQHHGISNPGLLDFLGCDSPSHADLDSVDEAAAAPSADDMHDAGAEVSPPPSGSTIMMGKVRASKREQERLGTAFFMSPVRRSARKMKISPGSRMEKILEEQSCSYKPNGALKGSLHVDESKPYSALKATATLKAAFQTNNLLDCEESPVKMPQFPGIDMGLGSYLEK